MTTTAKFSALALHIRWHTLSVAHRSFLLDSSSSCSPLLILPRFLLSIYSTLHWFCVLFSLKYPHPLHVLPVPALFVLYPLFFPLSRRPCLSVLSSWVSVVLAVYLKLLYSFRSPHLLSRSSFWSTFYSVMSILERSVPLPLCSILIVFFLSITSSYALTFHLCL